MALALYPAPQDSHAVAPKASLNFPGKHFVQAAAASPPKVPGVHRVQVSAEAPLYLPEGQLVQVVAPVPEYVPPRQTAHDTWPGAGCDRPAEQGEHTLVPVRFEEYPEVHDAHDDAPFDEAYAPLSHSMQSSSASWSFAALPLSLR